MPENRRLFPRMTVEDNLKLGAFHPGARGKAAEQLISSIRSSPDEGAAGSSRARSPAASSRCARSAGR